MKNFEIGNYFLPEENRKYFKKPLDKPYKTETQLKKVISILAEDSSIPKIISVGDTTTQVLLKNKIVPNLAIIDQHVQRKKIPLFDISCFELVNAKNPAGTIMYEAWFEIRKAIRNADNNVIIKIQGEEDLLVLPAICEAPLNSKVLYGQPNEGLVVVTVNEEIKQNVTILMQKMVKIDEN